MRTKLDPRPYPTGVKITKQEMARLHLVPDKFHGDWNYTILKSPA